MSRKSIIALILTATVGLSLLITSFILSNKKLPYSAIIKEAAANYSLAPALVTAIIEAESSFNKNATSKQGAVGLMQIMPTTADWIAKQLGLEEFSLKDPATNINFGCFYLAYLFSRFQDETLVIAAYNAGEGNVSNWIKEGLSIPNDIPFPETRAYVTKVQNSKQNFV